MMIVLFLRWVWPSYRGEVAIWNEGWGGTSSPSLQLSIKSPGECDRFDLNNAEKIPLEPSCCWQ